MQNYRKTSHTTYDCRYHIVWITKYRKKVLSGIVAERVRELLRGICKEHEVEILKGHFSKDNIHLFVSLPPQLVISKLVQYLKGKSSNKLLAENKDLSRQFLGRHLWGSGYFIVTSGNLTDEVILVYIKNQDNNETDDDFTMSDPL